MFRTLKAVAEVNGWIPTVISFEPHSNYVLRGPGDPLLLTTTEEKREFIESLGMDFLVFPFTPEVAKLPFDEFVRTELIEKRGVYVATARLPDGNGGERSFRAVVNIGTQPSTGNQRLAIEAYLLDFDEDIYGRPMVLDLMAILRTEQKFPSLDDLVRQIGMDADTARNYNGNHWAE